MEAAEFDVMRLARAYRAALVAWEPAVHASEVCAAIVEELARTENASSAARARGAARVADCRSHRARGFADALAALASTAASTSGTSGTSTKPAKRPSPAADVVIVQSAEVARRGHVHPGELWHVVGGGPVSPQEVEALIAAGAFVKAVLHDGEQVTHVAHYGRHLTAGMRTARGIGPPPEFDGRHCVEEGCERRLGLETDHVVPVAAGGRTSGENLRDRCLPHHWEKTERDRRTGRAGRDPPP